MEPDVLVADGETLSVTTVARENVDEMKSKIKEDSICYLAMCSPTSYERQNCEVELHKRSNSELSVMLEPSLSKEKSIIWNTQNDSTVSKHAENYDSEQDFTDSTADEIDHSFSRHFPKDNLKQCENQKNVDEVNNLCKWNPASQFSHQKENVHLPQHNFYTYQNVQLNDEENTEAVKIAVLSVEGSEQMDVKDEDKESERESELGRLTSDEEDEHRTDVTYVPENKNSYLSVQVRRQSGRIKNMIANKEKHEGMTSAIFKSRTNGRKLAKEPTKPAKQRLKTKRKTDKPTKYDQEKELSINFLCSVCGKVFDSQRQLSRHLKIHSDKRSHSCKDCGKSFREAGTLRTHYLSHNTEALPCQECGKMLKNELTLRIHMRTHNQGIRFICDVCGKSFKRAVSLKAHQTVHMPGGSQFKCIVCGRDCRTKEYLEVHMKRTHSNDSRTKRYQCSACDKYFKWEKTMELHAAIQHGIGKNVEELPACEMCGKRFAHISMVKAHMVKHNDQRDYCCDTCGATFKTKVTLDCHVNVVHSESRDFQCNLCGKTYKTKAYLYIHQQNVHKATTEYKCRSCPKAFKSKASLKAHEQRHSAKPTHYCAYCARGFLSLRDMRRHEMTHTGEKNFDCEICFKAFSRRDNLRTHMKVHIGEKQKKPDDKLLHIDRNVRSTVVTDTKQEMLNTVVNSTHITPVSVEYNNSSAYTQAPPGASLVHLPTAPTLPFRDEHIPATQVPYNTGHYDGQPMVISNPYASEPGHYFHLFN